MNMTCKYSRRRVEKSGDCGFRYLWVRRRIFSEFVDLNTSRSSYHQRRGQCALGRKSDSSELQRAYGGMMNAIGLQNPGIDLFCKRDIPISEKL